VVKHHVRDGQHAPVGAQLVCQRLQLVEAVPASERLVESSEVSGSGRCWQDGSRAPVLAARTGGVELKVVLETVRAARAAQLDHGRQVDHVVATLVRHAQSRLPLVEWAQALGQHRLALDAV